MHIPETEIIFEASRASGPGGQHVQKTSSRVTLRWSIYDSQVLNTRQKNLVCEKLAGRITKTGDLIIHVESHRSQLRNKKLAYKLLLELVNYALKVPKKRRKTRPTKNSVERRLKDKAKLSKKKVLRKDVAGE